MTKLTEDNKKLFIFRSGTQGDVNFIFDTWLNGLYFGNDNWRLMKEYTFKRYYQKLLETLLPRCVVNICALADDHDTIVGYCAYRGNILDWVFVKPAWRKIGIAKELIPEGVDTVSHMTRMVRGFKPKTWEYNPFI